jgi:hypothetical protein
MSNGSTNLQPNKLKSKNFLLNKSVDIDFNRIELSDNNITVTISALGLQTTNPNGLTMDCSLNMNENNIRNINSLGFYNGININDNYNNSIIGNNTDLTLSSDKALSLTTPSGVNNHININSGADIILETVINGGGLVATVDYIQLTARNQYINLEASNNINLSTGLLFDIILDTSFLKFINGIKITDENNTIIGDALKLELNSSFGNINLNAPTGNIDLTSFGQLNISSTDDEINLNVASNINLNAPNGSSDINLNSGGSISSTASVLNSVYGGNVEITSNIGGTQISAPYDSVNIITPQSTWFNLTTELTGDGTINCANVNGPSGIDLTTTSSKSLILNTSNSNGLISLNTASIADGGGINWNNYPMSITFFNQWEDIFNYNPIPLSSWQTVKHKSITFPPSFFYGTWAVTFSINCWGVGSFPADANLALYFDFVNNDSSITYNGINYTQATPYAQHFNPSTYINTSNTPMSITYTDYFTFNTINDNSLNIQLNWFALTSQIQHFKVSTTFTLMTLI